MSGEHTLPETLAGHWVTEAGRDMAVTYATISRASLCHGSMSDFELANRIFMASRTDLDLIAWQTAAKERIRWLSAQLAIAKATPTNGVKLAQPGASPEIDAISEEKL